jgi:hypothetical protein
LRYAKSTDYSNCAPLKGQKAYVHVEINGLKLGMSKSEVLRILGKPTKRVPNKWTYDLHGTVRDNAALEQSIYRARGFDKRYSYDWYFFIEVGFNGSAVSRLEPNPSVQQ